MNRSPAALHKFFIKGMKCNEINIMKNNIYSFATLMIFFIVASSVSIYSDNTFDIELDVIDGTALKDFYWSPDESSFIYYDTSKYPDAVSTDIDDKGSQVTYPLWQQYIINSRTLVSSITFPLQPDFTSDELATFAPYQDGFAYVSPNGDVIAYPKDISGTEYIGGLPLAIASISENAGITTNHIIDGLNSPDTTRFLWSGDSTKLAVNYVSNAGNSIIVYFDLKAGDNKLAAKEIEINSFNSYYPLVYANKAYAPVIPFEDQLLDISNSGRKVLFKGRLVSEHISSEPQKLIVWSPQSANENDVIEQIEGNTVLAASFLPNSDTQIFIVNDSGLVTYNLATKESIIMGPDLNSTSLVKASFSPNGTWLAVVTQNKLSFLNLSSLVLSPPATTVL
jgi:hypothetical protein